MKNLFKLVLPIFFLAFTDIYAEPKNDLGQATNVVKKSLSGICHIPNSTYFTRTKNYTPFKTLDECLKSGGRLPKK